MAVALAMDYQLAVVVEVLEPWDLEHIEYWDQSWLHLLHCNLQDLLQEGIVFHQVESHSVYLHHPKEFDRIHYIKSYFLQKELKCLAHIQFYNPLLFLSYNSPLNFSLELQVQVDESPNNKPHPLLTSILSYLKYLRINSTNEIRTSLLSKLFTKFIF